MKKALSLSLIILSAAFFACGNHEEKKQEDGAVPHDTSNGISASQDSLTSDSAAIAYICPCGGCPEVREPKAGKCPKCEMELVAEKK